jgi:hypothetical protein
MRILFAIAFLLAANILFAQKPFEGTIVYSLKATHEKDDAQLTVEFAPNKIKIRLKEKEKFDDTYILIDLDSGKVYTVNIEDKNYRFKNLPVVDTTPPQPVGSKTIAGYHTEPITTTVKGMPFSIGGLGGSTTLFVANDLYYPIPKKYATIDELVLVQNDRIVLGAEISMPSPFAGSQNDTINVVVITAEAQSVAKKTFDPTVFRVPKDYTLSTFEDWPVTDSVTMVDTTAMYPDKTIAVGTDTLMLGPKKEGTSSPNPKPAPKKTAPVKGDATKPKKKQ